jgi:hypothetical protein
MLQGRCCLVGDVGPLTNLCRCTYLAWTCKQAGHICTMNALGVYLLQGTSCLAAECTHQQPMGCSVYLMQPLRLTCSLYVSMSPVHHLLLVTSVPSVLSCQVHESTVPQGQDRVCGAIRTQLWDTQVMGAARLGAEHGRIGEAWKAVCLLHGCFHQVPPSATKNPNPNPQTKP